jgi:hypothetical protein
MNIDEEREKLRKRIEGLNDLGALIQRVQAHAKYISTIPVDERSNLQNIWMLAYEATELKMAPGTDETLFEAAINLQTLDNMSQQTTKDSPPTYKDRPRFSFFGRRGERTLASRGRSRDESPEKQRTDESTDHGDSAANANILNALNMHCEHHLLHVANFDDVHWKKADQEHNLREILVAYCAAIGGTQDAVNTMFKPYEDQLEAPDESGMFERIKLRKLKHLMQLRTYFEFKLKLQLLDQDGREKFEAQIKEILRPESAEQVEGVST